MGCAPNYAWFNSKTYPIRASILWGIMKKKFVNTVKVFSPFRQTFEVYHRYDKEWKTNFITLSCTDTYPKEEGRRDITEELNFCLNSKEEATKLIKMLQTVMGRIK